MSVNYYMFLEEVRIITGHVDTIQKTTRKKVLKSIFFVDDLLSQLKCFNNLLSGDLKK
ncbi:MAG: hypothetical protein ACFE9S_02655 [Candidatus Hermodarchaeota archaeon]